jgi:hypothetical protein
MQSEAPIDSILQPEITENKNWQKRVEFLKNMTAEQRVELLKFCEKGVSSVVE